MDKKLPYDELKRKFDYLESQIEILLDGNSLEEFHAFFTRQPDTELVNSLNLIFTLAGNIDQSEWPVINQRIQAIAKNLLAKYKEQG